MASGLAFNCIRDRYSDQQVALMQQKYNEKRRPDSSPPPPTPLPTSKPTPKPTATPPPTAPPTPLPTNKPTVSVTPRPTRAPTPPPTAPPTPFPTSKPTAKPTVGSTPRPTQPVPPPPTKQPTAKPTVTATPRPTLAATPPPTRPTTPGPTTKPTSRPTSKPTASPTRVPTTPPTPTTLNIAVSFFVIQGDDFEDDVPPAVIRQYLDYLNTLNQYGFVFDWTKTVRHQSSTRQACTNLQEIGTYFEQYRDADSLKSDLLIYLCHIEQATSSTPQAAGTVLDGIVLSSLMTDREERRVTVLEQFGRWMGLAGEFSVFSSSQVARMRANFEAYRQGSYPLPAPVSSPPLTLSPVAGSPVSSPSAPIAQSPEPSGTSAPIGDNAEIENPGDDDDGECGGPALFCKGWFLYVCVHAVYIFVVKHDDSNSSLLSLGFVYRQNYSMLLVFTSRNSRLPSRIIGT